MSRSSQLSAAIGLLMTLAGSALLYHYADPKLTVGNIRVEGNVAYQLEGRPHVADDPALWQSRATSYLARAARRSRRGFGMIAVGTLLQLLALWL